MALELKQGLRLSQQLRMTPQLQQAIKLLQLSRLELETVITKEMEENPVLEEAGEALEDEAAAKEKSSATSMTTVTSKRRCRRFVPKKIFPRVKSKTFLN